MEIIETLNEIIDLVTFSIEGLDIKIKVDFKGVSINKTIGDRNRIQQVLMNLLTNSKKFVPRNNGIIEITASTKLITNHFVHLEV